MNHVLPQLTIKEIEIEDELVRLEGLKGHPNETLRQVSLTSNKERLGQIHEAKELLLTEFYYIVLAFNSDTEKYPHRKGLEDIPSYLANYHLNVNKGMCIQSNIYDSIKFPRKEDAILFQEEAKKKFADWTFELAPMSRLIFGKGIHRFVYNKQ